jgi:hypothetical protein
MRRCRDDWINASHILKVAGLDKSSRTSYLERVVHRECTRQCKVGIESIKVYGLAGVFREAC